jgi:glycosyltransferase involved in cell wall biosynthesis
LLSEPETGQQAEKSGAENMARKDLLIIIPAYNEEESIEFLLDQLEQPRIARIADVLVMNDHSSDKTNLMVKKRNHALVTHVYNLGYGGGLRLGYKYAVRRGYQYVIQMDADGQHDVCNIPKIYKALKTADENGFLPDIVLGSRFMEGSFPFPVSFAKKVAFGLFRQMIRMGTGQKIMDPTTGLQGLSRRAFLFYSKYNQFDDSYPDANMIIQMLLLGFRVREIPAVMHARTGGCSMHAGLEPIAYMVRMFFSILAVEFKIKVLKWKVNGIEDYGLVFPEKQAGY